MLIKTLLNKALNYKGFVFDKGRFGENIDGTPTILVEIRPRKGSKMICSSCGMTAPGYDTLAPRRFEHIPIWGFFVLFIYAMRRVDCKKCGVTVEKVPWAQGKALAAREYSWFLARWAKKLSWKETAEAFQTTWFQVFSSVKMAVEWGRLNMDLSGITAIGVDEVLWQRGHKYLTVAYQIDDHCKRLIWVGKDRTVKTLLRFFQWFGSENTASIQFVCSDMWKPYLKVIKKKAGHALHVLDRYHIAANMNKAIDQVRAGEAKALETKGLMPILKKTRWLFLKRPENLTEKQDSKLADIVQYNLRSVRSYLLKEDFQKFWEYKSPYWAGKFLDVWCKKVMRSRIDPMKKIAKMMRAHRPLILNWFRAKGEISSGAVEGLNNKLKLTIRKSYGFRTFNATEIALYHALGKLPEPETTHKFF